MKTKEKKEPNFIRSSPSTAKTQRVLEKITIRRQEQLDQFKQDMDSSYLDQLDIFKNRMHTSYGKNQNNQDYDLEMNEKKKLNREIDQLNEMSTDKEKSMQQSKVFHE